MWADLLHYGQVVGWRWFVIVATVIIAVGDVTKRVFPTWQAWADAHGFPSNRRRFIEITSLIIALGWAGFTAWQDEYSAHQDAIGDLAKARADTAYWKGRAATPAPVAFAPVAPPPKMVFEPLPAPQPKMPLERLLAFSDYGLEMEPIPAAGTYLKAFVVQTVNTGDLIARPHMESMHATVDGIPLKNPLSQQELGLIARGQSYRLTMAYSEKGIEIQRLAKNITLDFTLSYDSEPKTGTRTVYKKIRFDLTWPNPPGNDPGIAQHILDEREY